MFLFFRVQGFCVQIDSKGSEDRGTSSIQNNMQQNMVRIHKVIAQAGLSSRRGAEKLILQGVVSLNGEMVSRPGDKMQVGVDELRVDGQLVQLTSHATKKVYALYKPKSCITTLHDPEERVIISDFFPKTSERLFPVGRLDYDAEGLVFITNDGELSNLLMHPRHKVWKSYFVKLKGLITAQELAKLRKKPVVDRKVRLPFRAKILHTVNDKTWLEVSLREGTNRQIKKMFFQAKYSVLKIKRFRIGNVGLDDLKPGESRLLTPEEIEGLENLCATGKSKSS